MNLSPGGLDEVGFPYFASDKFDFGYGGPPFHPHDSHFFPGHPGMPFANGPGKVKWLLLTEYETNFQIYLGMVNDFGMTPDASFLNQPNGPPITGANPSERSGSPEFMTSGNFFKEEPSNNEGLVW